MVKARKIVLAKRFQGTPKESDFQLVEEELPPLKDGEALFEALYLSVDPYMRPEANRHPLGETMMGEQLARCIESRNPDIKKGSWILAHYGWRTHTVVSELGEDAPRTLTRVDEKHFGDLPKSLSLGILGMTGATAYLGLLHHGQLKPGETVLVNAAAGAVGSVVGQVAKIKGCRVIGYAGTDAKCQWLKNLGFDHVFNYKKVNLSESLNQAAPEGIDVYFDNVGGEFTYTVIRRHMAVCGRVVVCGNTSQYNLTNPPKFHSLWPIVITKRLTIRGIVIYTDYSLEQWREAFAQMRHWIKEGQLKYEETVTEGFENMPKAFIGLLTGNNYGKAVAKL